MSSIIQQKAKRAAEDKFEKFVNGETGGFNVLVETAWAEAKSKFEDHESGYGVFDFYVSAKDHPEITCAHVYDMMRTMDDFKDDLSRLLVYKKGNGKDEEAKFEISIVYGKLRDEQFETLVDEHRAKKRRTDAPAKKEPVKKEEEDAMSEGEREHELRIEKEMEAAAAASEAAAAALTTLTDAEEEEENESSQAGGTLSGYPDDGTTPENATFEALLKAGTLRLKLVERPGHAPDQAIEPGPKGRKSHVFEHKELFKQCAPRFFFNGEAKEWRRTAPEGWTSQPPAAA